MLGTSRPAAALLILGLGSAVAAGTPAATEARDTRPGAGSGAPTTRDLRASGVVHLETTCREEVKADFQTAVALLHSFFYEEARSRFEDLARRDPRCAMAWWGVAMTWYHPLWAAPTPPEMLAGQEALEKAKALGGKTDLERGLIAAIDAYFSGREGPPEKGQPAPATEGTAALSCHGPRTHSARAEAFLQELEKLRHEHPRNLEVAVFYSLALLATAPPTDRTYEKQLLATAILEPLFEKNTGHPGIPHYLIHAYDYPALASRGLAAARHYGDVAPWVPHALHMPSHIYTRLGMWADSIQANLASADAARRYTARVADGAAWYDELHALDYLMFAYMQSAQATKAGEVLEYVRGLRKFHQPNFAAAYAIGAIPARYTLERHDWKEAAALEVMHPDVVGPFPFAVAHVEFAKGIGAARSGDVALARGALGRLGELRDALKGPQFEWWIDQIEIQRLAVSAWIARAEKQDTEALRLMREAVELEGRAGTHPVTPGQILPTNEQLGDLLLELGRPGEALAAYEASLEAFPGRFNGHYGAARAAELADQPAGARTHYQQVLAMAGGGDGRTVELAQARRYLDSK